MRFAGHPVGVHHTLVATDPSKPIKWCNNTADHHNLVEQGHLSILRERFMCSDCIAMNCHLTDPEKPYLALLEPELAKTISEATVGAAARL